MARPRRARRRSVLVVVRELTRAAKRWQRIPVRVGLVGSLLLVFVVVLLLGPDVRDAHSAARLGRSLFTSSYISLILASVVLPGLLITQAVQSEREGGTLELLALTGIQPSQVLWGLLGSRSVRAFLLLAAGAPLLALLPSLGGIGSLHAAAALVALSSVFLTSTALCGVLGVAARAAPVAVIAATGWWLVFGVLAPIRMIAIYRETTHLDTPTFLVPTAMALQDGISWEMALGLGPWVTTILVAIVVASWRFRQGIATGWESRGKSWPGPWWGWVWHLPVQIGAWVWMERSYATAPPVWQSSSVPPLGSPEQVALLVAVMLLALASGSILYLRAMSWLLPRLDLSRTWFRVPVIGDPILWRELFTNAQGGLSRAVGIATFAWLVVAVLLGAVTDDDGPLVAWTLVGCVGVLSLTVLLVTSSVLEERRARTLPLLVSTTLSPWAIVRGKLAASMVRVLPLACLCTLSGFLALPVTLGVAWGPDELWSDTTLLDIRVLTQVPYSRGLGAVLWAMGVWFAASGTALWLAIRVRNRVLAAALPAILVFVIAVVMPIVGVTLHETGHHVELLEDLGLLVFPGISFVERRRSAGVAIAALLSAAAWWSLAAATAGLAARSLGRVGTRQER